MGEPEPLRRWGRHGEGRLLGWPIPMPVVAGGKVRSVTTLDSAATVAILAAMVPELRPIVRGMSLKTVGDRNDLIRTGQLGDRQIIGAVTSMGTVAAEAATERVLERYDVDWVIVVGICGAIDPSLSIGQLIVPEVTVDESVDVESHPTALPGHTASGRLLTTNTLYDQPEDLESLRTRGFIAVDMETAAIGRVCESHNVGWSVFRAVSDRAGDPVVDAGVIGMINADGSANPVAVARYVATHPHRIPKMAKLGQGMNKAVRASTQAAFAAIGVDSHTDSAPTDSDADPDNDTDPPTST